jgi:SAM-dependent methyltransferase
MTAKVLGRLRPRRRVGWLWVVITLATLANGLRLRARIDALPETAEVPPAPGDPVADTGPLAVTADLDHAFVTAAGIRLDDATKRGASLYARRHHLDVLDLIPDDLGVDQVLELARLVDPATYASNPFSPGRGPRQATLVHRAVLERAGIDQVDQLDPVSYVRVTAELKRFAAKSTDLAIVAGLRAVPEDLSRRRACLSALYSKAMPAVAAVPAVQCTLLGVGLFLAPGWGAAALASFWAQPYLAIGGTGIRPRDLTPIGALTRPLRGAWGTLRTVTAPSEAPGPGSGGRTDEQQAADYDELLAGGIGRFFEPRRSTCPLCQGTSLSGRVRVPDLLQFKPGEFELDECAACGHIFQNPRLSLEGLDFYYRDFYDGVGGEQVAFVFSADDTSYRGRVDLVAAHARPKRWLDVGAGHGHFCVVASGVLPDTRFEGLDLSDSIVEAERHQWIERAHVGMFPELADDLLETYDVVSMHHYLEHTRDPGEELTAAAKVLEPGGHLLIEVPDPECAYGRTLGWMWGPWFQPQHQHFVSARNLAAMLTDRGFTVVAEERGAAHQPVDLAFAVLLLLNRIAGPPKKPWLAPPRMRARVRRTVVFSALAPLAVAALILDRLIAPVVRRRPGGSNTYRMLARKI